MQSTKSKFHEVFEWYKDNLQSSFTIFLQYLRWLYITHQIVVVVLLYVLYMYVVAVR